MARLDRFLVLDNWEDHFGNVTKTILPKPLSDHFHILFFFFFGGGGGGGGSTSRGLSPFCFENMWLKVEGFKDCITKWWESFVFKGTSSFVLVEKLKALKHKLKSWNKEVFGRVEDRKKTTL